RTPGSRSRCERTPTRMKKDHSAGEPGVSWPLQLQRQGVPARRRRLVSEAVVEDGDAGPGGRGGVLARDPVPPRPPAVPGKPFSPPTVAGTGGCQRRGPRAVLG